MRRPLVPSIVAWLIFASSACAKAPGAAGPQPQPPRETGDLRVVVTGLEHARGRVLIALFVSPDGWPDDENAALRAADRPIEDLQAIAGFEDVPAGPFAVSVFHDEDEDGELDTGVFGIPTEPYGFSRDARGTFGPPSFEDARLEVAAGESLSLTIKVE